ncbi:hypothetical protein F53441_10890 [Fusarium austroafricanum]|uniref:2EXR domain-containing protein n=1 Tax=Fusarium austroafricanum TaxID=2364996 RepID=A0A8H4K8K5_9HYPO|nr:hypothetical protein F53441_10890 [Fusarium austroafricanum]
MSNSEQTTVVDTVSPNQHRRYQILNPATEDAGNFPQFKNLPSELRRNIWEQALKHERLLEITLNRLAVSGNGCTILLQERWALSKLFRVNSESRTTAMGFYRVHLPCVYRYRERESDGVLYLNPELDILHVHGYGWEHFARFAYDVWVHDRYQVGLVNLALGFSAPRNPQDAWDRSKPENLPLPCMGLRRLKRVIFIFKIVDDATFWGCDRPCHRQGDNWPRWHVDNYAPIMTKVPLFDVLSQDPRSIRKYLERMRLCEGLDDPRDKVENWFLHLESLGVQNDPGVLYQYIVGYDCCSPGIVDREDAIG